MQCSFTSQIIFRKGINCNEGLRDVLRSRHIATKCPLPINKSECPKCCKIGHVNLANFVEIVTAAVTSSGVHSPATPPPTVDLSPYLYVHALTLNNQSLFLFYVILQTPITDIICIKTWVSKYLTILEELQAIVIYKNFTCNLPILVMDGVVPKLLGHISMQGVYILSPDISYDGMSNEAFSTIINLPAVSGYSTGCYKEPPHHIGINPAVAPVYQQT
ncbi:hypothetical protein PR048_033198 [Dryococelus australis]|uniref:Uncharacterized protein n=1 Tax=Dryococelus australis TaxID=614101 RepID=A0ABQ9G2X6_9NEOP|nr:hypothetical protein PR048_033198 [Dryococelus australis]